MANLNFRTGGRSAQSSAGSVAAPPPPSAPLLPPARAALFAQRTFADRRSLLPSGGVAPGGSASQSSQSASKVLSGRDDGGGGGAPPLLDPSEFPSLTARGHGDQPHHHAPPPGSKPYVGMVKQPTADQNEFTMSSEDFPALPGTGSASNLAPESPEDAEPPVPVPVAPPTPPPCVDPLLVEKSRRPGVQTLPDGRVTNIPPTMVPNQYGIIGLLTFLRAAETQPDLVSLALGQDLTTLGLNLNSPDNLYLTFAGPWTDAPCRPQDIDYHVPPEYLINTSIREKLAPLKMSRYKEDLLFYLFYCFVGDQLQIAAALELYNREWRYHTEEKVWITQGPGLATLEKTTTYERGTYYYFDAQNWRKIAKEFHLDYSKLEGRPQLPPHYHA